jgi:predicted DNA binding CopG/RHH family protein
MSATATKKSKTISAQDFDQLADTGADEIDQFLDWEKATRPNLESKRLTLDLPSHFLQQLDRQATIRGITRQSLIKSWLFDRLKAETK